MTFTPVFLEGKLFQILSRFESFRSAGGSGGSLVSWAGGRLDRSHHHYTTTKGNYFTKRNYYSTTNSGPLYRDYLANNKLYCFSDSIAGLE